MDILGFISSLNKNISELRRSDGGWMPHCVPDWRCGYFGAEVLA
jgi:hypothetical protein